MSLPLLHSPADILRALVIDLGQGADPDLGGNWPVYATNEPSMPDNVITLYDTTPQYDMRAMVDGESSFHWAYQVRVRSASHPAGLVKMDAIRVALDEQIYANALTLGSAHYVVYNVAKSGGILYLGVDNPSSKRSLFTLNGYVALRRLS
jgi:hypothetical protein